MNGYHFYINYTTTTTYQFLCDVGTGDDCVGNWTMEDCVGKKCIKVVLNEQQ